MNFVGRLRATSTSRCEAPLMARLISRGGWGNNLQRHCFTARMGAFAAGERSLSIGRMFFNKKLLQVQGKHRKLISIALRDWKTWKDSYQKCWGNLLPDHTRGLLVFVSGCCVMRSSLAIVQCERVKLSHKSRVSAQHMNEKTKETLNKNGTESRNKIDLTFDWKLFFRFLWPDMWLFAFASLSAFAVALVNIQLPTLLGNLVNAISSLGRESDELSDVLTVLYEPAVKLMINYGAQSVLTFTYISLLSSFGERFAARLRTALFNSLVCQDVAFFDVHKTGELVNRLTTDVQDFKSSFKQCISQGLKSVTQSIGCIVTMYAISPKLTTVMLVIVPGIILTGTLIGSLLRRLSRNAQEQVAQATATADEALSNIRVVRSFAMEEQEARWYSKEIYKSQYLNELLGMGIGVFQGLSNLAINSMVLVVLYSGGVLLDSQQISAGQLMSFLMSMQTIQRSLAVLSILYGQVLRGIGAGSRTFEYINVKPTIPVKGGQLIPPGHLKGQIEFKNVYFRYPSRHEHSVLEDLNLKVESGKVVALCGPSGSGKSTIASLIERFYDSESGSIEIDGVDIKVLDPAWLRGQLVGFISQEPILFATSIKENIRYGRPNATDEEVYEAAKIANADDFIRDFPEGYDTVLGERGVTVSGGQKQRIAIARALLKDPQILILDEATSALDAESERIVQDALDKAVHGRTVLVIAHRLSTIRNADLIAVLSGGRIQELGTHEELLRKKGLYAELVKRQTDKKPYGT